MQAATAQGGPTLPNVNARRVTLEVHLERPRYRTRAGAENTSFTSGLLDEIDALQIPSRLGGRADFRDSRRPLSEN